MGKIKKDTLANIGFGFLAVLIICAMIFMAIFGKRIQYHFYRPLVEETVVKILQEKGIIE